MVSLMPFPIRRPWLMTRGAMTDRNQPPFDRLRSIDDPDEFLWAILPHAARSFAPSILLLPEEAARTTAVGYLYARMLDTYEDLSSTPADARHALSAFAARFQHGRPGIAPPAPIPTGPDNRDRAHLLLIERHPLVDESFLALAAADQRRVVRLITEMAAGMSEFSTLFEEQGGVLHSDEQVLGYCDRVIGLPALFVLELLLGEPTDQHSRDGLEVAELIQLANITRDIEKDLTRGVAYHRALEPHLRAGRTDDASAAVALARHDLLKLAGERAPSFRRLVGSSNLSRVSVIRSAAVIMMLFTHGHYRSQTGRVRGRHLPRRVTSMFLMALPASVSPRWANWVLRRIEEDLDAMSGSWDSQAHVARQHSVAVPGGRARSGHAVNQPRGSAVHRPVRARDARR